MYKIELYLRKGPSKILEQFKRVAKASSKTLIVYQFPIILSGDHSTALGTTSEIRTINPHEDLGVVRIDAHAETHLRFIFPFMQYLWQAACSSAGNRQGRKSK
ncbi:MAG: hypothetical protein EOO20_07310 [Chryseobacterium sp.]|jgi:arginase family enzyme|uniref:arginase family protein n=1 Tax=Pedobacter sp. Leaf41 TaxID=1736218 RepID=UPI000703A5E3|nr:arginase family protein [Pedobacter sp. Leaf41]KQN36145.1 hypothetical protein ASE92_08425 [Pedobacter sp. Leaf41]RZJ90725.1 MAG: hypothetical protein EOO20_07310 [Chryseobacterium sp.]